MALFRGTSIIAAMAIVAAGAACSSSKPTAKSTTTKAPEPFVTSPASRASDKVSLAEATEVMRSLHTTFPKYCAAPKWRFNITADPALGIPAPGATGDCVFFNEDITSLAFRLTSDRDAYVQRWTARLCKLSNVDGHVLMGGAAFVIRDHSATLTTRGDTATVIAAAVNGTYRYESCAVPGTPVSAPLAVDTASSLSKRLTNAGVPCATINIDPANPLYRGNALFAGSPAGLIAVFGRCSANPEIEILAMRVQASAADTRTVFDGAKNSLCKQDSKTRRVSAADTTIYSANAKVMDAITKALVAGGSAGC